MKYSIGYKVRIKSIDWYNQMLSIPNKLVWSNKLTNEFIGIWCGSYIFTKEMCSFCGSVMTIKEVGEDYYIMEEDIYNKKFNDEMIGDVVVPKFKIDDKVETNDGLFGYITEVRYDEKVDCYEYYVSFVVDGGYYYEKQLKLYKKESDSIVPKFKVGDEIVKKDSISNSYLVSSVGGDYYGLSLSLPNSNGVGVLPVKDQDEWVLLSDSNVENCEKVEKPSLIDLNNEISLPDGYEFRDGDGNLIAVDKIVLAKKGVRYPSTPKECCEILNTEETYMGIGGHKGKLLGKFQRLLICRDAYWKIAGEEMGLGKSWEPIDNKVFGIIRQHGKIQNYNDFVGGSTILEFPTEEMRDAFYEAFKKLIEECKELL